MTNISDSEMEIMEVIWQHDDFINVKDIFHELPSNNKWKYNTVATFTLRLAEKGFLMHRKNGWTNEYKAAISRVEYKKRETKNFLEKIHKGSKKSMVATLFHDELSEDDFDDLMKWLDKR